MANEVGSLNASLTLDMSDFQAGMAEARTLAAELASALQQAFNPGAGSAQMIRDIQEMVQAISLLRAELTELKALQESMSGADLFAAMKAHTATLPGDIANIRNELSSLSTALYSLNDDVELIIANIREGLASGLGPFQTSLADAQASLSSLAGSASALVAALQPLSTTGTLVDFSVPLGQLQQMLSLVEQIATALRNLNPVNMDTGEIVDEDAMSGSFYNVMLLLQNIQTQLEACGTVLNELIVLTNEWNAALAEVEQTCVRITGQLAGAAGNTQGITRAMRNTSRNTQNFANQANKAAKNLRTTKGYALSIQGIIGGIIVSQAFYRLLDIMQRLVQGAKEFSTSMQDAAVSFKYLMKGNTDVSSGSILNALTNIAQTSPMSASSLVDASRQLMAMGFSAKSTVPTLNILVDTAAAVGGSASEMSDKIQHITLAFGQMVAAGKVSAQELRQLYNAGLPIYELLSKGLGISMKEAKNIGKLNVDSATAVYAILQQLQERYAGAAKDLSRTVAGSLEVIKESLQITLARAWQPYFEKVNTILNNLADRFVAFSKITQAYGIGGLFQAIFPQNLWAPLRQLLAGLIQLGRAFADVGRIIMSSFGQALSWVVRILGPVIYAIGSLARIIAALARAAYVTYPAIRVLFAAVSFLVIAGVIAKLVLVLAKAIWWLSGAAAAAKAIATLVKAIAGLAVAHPVTFVLLAIAAAFLAIVAASEKARAAIAAFFGKAMSGVQDFMQSLDIGMDPGDVAMPEFQMPDMDDFSSGIEDIIDDMDDLGDAEDDAGKKSKKLKDNLQSFDEVYRIGDEDDSGGDDDDKFGDLFDKLKGLGDLDYSDLFNWAGDWATDWGALTAGLDDLIGDLGEGIGDIVDWMKQLVDAITGGDGPKALLDLCDALSIFFALLGNLKVAGMLQIVQGLIKIFDAITDALEHGWNFDNIMELIDGLMDVIIGFGLLTGQWKLVGFGLVIQGLHDIIVGINDICKEGLNIDNAMKILDGIGKFLTGLGLLTGNLKLAGVGLMISGVSRIIKELGALVKGFKTGDWSDVNWASLITGIVEFVAGMLLFFGIIKKLGNVKAASDAADAAANAGRAAGKVDETIKGQVSPKLMSLMKNLAVALVIIAEVCTAALMIVGTIILLGKMFGMMADAWDLSGEEALRCVVAMGIGVALLAGIGVAMAKLGELGTSMIVQMAFGAAILAEICAMVDLFVLNLALLGQIFQLVASTWEPVVENINVVLIALGIGTGLMVAIGVAMGLLGAAGTEMIVQMALGAAVLAEIAAAADLFALNLALMGQIFQLVVETWTPVNEAMPVLITALEVGCGLVVAVGVACGLLGAAGTEMIVQMALGTAVLAEVCVAADLFIINLALMGLEMQLVADTWAPVIAQLPTVEQAIIIGSGLLIAIGVACGLMGTFGSALIAPMALGTALLAEASVACDLFIAEIWAIGLLLQQVIEAWQPVLAQGSVVEQAILTGTALLLAVGAACALLGVATVASAGLLPLAIALGTAMLLECTVAVTALIQSIIVIANQITNELLPALTAVNEVIPQATEYMNTFVAFMKDFATASSSYTASMGDLTWDGIVQGFLSFFGGNPIANMASKIESIGNDVANLNAKLEVANAELEKCIGLLTSYNSFMKEMQLLCQNGGTVELQSGMFTNLKQVGEKLVTGLIDGINAKKPQAQTTAQQLGQSVVDALRNKIQSSTSTLRQLSDQMGNQMMQGVQSGIQRGNGPLQSTIQQVFNQIRSAFQSFFNASNWVIYGQQICNGISQGISANSGRVIAQAQALANQVRQIIQSALNMHSPSRVMMTLGGYIDEGLAIGMEQKAKEVAAAAQGVADALRNTMEDADRPTLSVDNVSTGTLTDLQSWSNNFVNILADMFEKIATLFDELGDKLANLNRGKGIEAKIGSVRAADQLASQSTNTTGTQQVVAILDENSMKQLASMAADRMYEYLAPLFASLDGDAQDRMIAYVGTLVADDAGLRELERKLNVIRLSEGRRS